MVYRFFLLRKIACVVIRELRWSISIGVVYLINMLVTIATTYLYMLSSLIIYQKFVTMLRLFSLSNIKQSEHAFDNKQTNEIA